MLKSLRTNRHKALRKMLVDARKKAGLTQAQAAALIKKPQSFIAKTEGGERRLDIVEFIDLARALNLDPAEVVRKLAKVRG